MRDPHVEILFFTCEPSGELYFKNPPPLSRENDISTLKLENGILEVKPKAHYATPDEARQDIEPFLRAWEFDSDLRLGLGSIRFKYREAKIIDRDPPPPGSSQTIKPPTGASVLVSASALQHVELSNYPEPPLFLRLPPDTKYMWYQYVRYFKGKQTLQGMAYFCLTAVERVAPDSFKHKKREYVAKHYNIEKTVLETLGKLTEKGDSETARKVVWGKPFEPLSDLQSAWIDSAIKAIIRRMVEQSAGISGPQLSMKDLPSL